MQVGEAMTVRAETIGPGDALRDAARKMRDIGIGALPVCDGDRLVGMLTDRDIVVRSIAAGVAPDAGKVRDAMTPQARTYATGTSTCTRSSRHTVGSCSVDAGE